MRIAAARHDALAELHVVGLQALAHAVDIARGKSDVVEPAGIVVFFLGTTHHDALARLARAHQVHGGDAAGIEPITGEVERRAVAVLQPKHVAIEVLGALQIGRFDGVMLQGAERHRVSP